MLLNFDVGPPLEGWHRAQLILIIEMLHWMTLTEPFGNEKVQLCSRERVIYSSDMCSMGTGTNHIRKITFHLHKMIYLVSITIFTISCKFIHVPGFTGYWVQFCFFFKMYHNSCFLSQFGVCDLFLFQIILYFAICITI